MLKSFWTAVVSVILASAVYGQTGSVSGVATDSSLQGALVGARVSVEGQGIGATTDSSGRYLLLGVPAGKAKITVSYLGLESESKEVDVAAGKTAALDFALTPSAVSSSIVVKESPDLVGQERALNDQQNSINLVNIIASDQMGSFPDPNAAEAVQRAPGI